MKKNTPTYTPTETDERIMALIAYRDYECGIEVADLVRTALKLAFNTGLSVGLNKGIKAVEEVEARLHQLIIPFVR